MATPITVRLNSEFGPLDSVVVHSPGVEIERMSPSNATRALYSDILNLDIAREEYAPFRGTLSRVANVIELADLLTEALSKPQARQFLLDGLCPSKYPALRYELDAIPPAQLATLMIEGVPMPRHSLRGFLSEDRYIIPPLYNFYFMRDSSMALGAFMLLGRMASPVRYGETRIMETIFRFSDTLHADVINPADSPLANEIRIEGGDVHVAREDILLIGNGQRTNAAGVDFVVENLVERGLYKPLHVFVQQLPKGPESFIHLDMIFTLLSPEDCMIYEPVIRGHTSLRTIHMVIQPDGSRTIAYCDDLVTELNRLGMPLKPIICGGTKDSWHQEREQWHSGANFVAFGPGKVIGYARNQHTIDEMASRGFAVVPAEDAAQGKVDLSGKGKFVVILDGSELPRGGGGGRCMTLPVNRKPLE